VLGNTKQKGFTIVELTLAFTAGMVISLMVTAFTFALYSDTVKAQTETAMLMDSQILLRRVAEDVRYSSTILPTNNLPDAYQPAGWNTDNENHILILSAPAQDSDRNFVINEETGSPYQNEIILYSSGDKLYRRTIANPDVADNRISSTCPESSANCRNDPILSEQFKDMTFIFFDQNGSQINQESGNITDARSIEIIIDLEDRKFGETISVDNRVRMTLRNPFFN
jgi:type II secretory pathway pseudopilin PulG